MADAATTNPVFGYSLHTKTTQLIEEFIKNILDNDFQYLDEILAEVKEHFGRRDSVALLPKTPCMKRKRKRVIRSLDDSLENQTPSSPVRDQTKAKDGCESPESKKPVISVSCESPREILESNKQRNGGGRVTRARASKNKKQNCEDLEASVQETGKTRTRGAKNRKLSRGFKQQQVKRNTRNAAKQTGNDNEQLDKVVEKKATPKRITRSKRKQEAEIFVTPDKMSAIQVDLPVNSPVQCKPKKFKLSVTPVKEIKSAIEVYIPDTPDVELNSKKINAEKPKAIKSSINLVLTTTPTAEQISEVESNVLDEVKETALLNPVLIVEAVTYENEEKPENKNPEPVSQEQVISEATVSSTKKPYKRQTRSRSIGASPCRGKKRKQDEEDEDDGPGVISSSKANNDIGTEEAVPKMQKIEESTSKSDSDNAIVSSTVDSPVKSQRKSTRASRGNRRSSRLSVQAVKNQRKSKIRKSRSLVKSSIMLKLSAQKIMPNLTPDQKQDSTVDSVSPSNSNELDIVKTNLFKDQNTDSKKEAEPTSELCEVHSSTPTKMTNKDDVDDNATEAEDEEFHDAQETVEEVVDGGEYNKTTEAVVDEKEVALPRPATRSSSRNQSKDSQSSEDSNCSFSSQSGSQSSQKEATDSSQCSSECEHDTQEDQCKDKNQFYFGQGKVIKNSAGVIHSFIKRNTPKKIDRKEKSRLMKLAILEKQEKEKERIEQLELLKQMRIESQKRRREEKERKAAELRAAKAREEKERREKIEKKFDMRKQLEEKARKEKEKEEEVKRKARLQKKLELDARRKQEEEHRQQKIQEKEDEDKRHREMLRRKAEFEEQERQRKIIEAKRQQELREQELEREREQEKHRLVKEIEEKERKAKEEKEKAEKKMREEKEKEEKERKRIAQLLREKEENERKEREKRAKEDKWRQERERKLREERERKLREEREAAYRDELQKEREKQRKLEEQRTTEEARLRSLQSSDSYDMTPPPPPRVRSATTSENYNIDDICSDDSTDDEDAPRKRIPVWAQGAKLKAALINQSMDKFDVEAIFGGVAMPNLDEIFTYKKKKRFYQRTSSAHWDSPPLRTLNRGSTLI